MTETVLGADAVEDSMRLVIVLVNTLDLVRIFVENDVSVSVAVVSLI